MSDSLALINFFYFSAFDQTTKQLMYSKYNFNFSPEEMDYINNLRNFLEREIKFLETVNLKTLQNCYVVIYNKMNRYRAYGVKMTLGLF